MSILYMAMTHIQKTRREGLWFLAVALTFICSIGGAMAILDSGNDAFKNTHWARQTTHASDEELNMAALHKHFDILTPNGWRGKIEHKKNSNELVMKLIDYVGKPINGIFVAAQVRSENSSQPAYNNMLTQGASGDYRSGKLGLKKGTWNLTITARDPNSSSETDMIFRFEKRIIVD